jgi:hypothetical protein
MKKNISPFKTKLLLKKQKLLYDNFSLNNISLLCIKNC